MSRVEGLGFRGINGDSNGQDTREAGYCTGNYRDSGRILDFGFGI